MPGENSNNQLAMRRDIAERCDRLLLETAADKDPSWQTEKAAYDLRLWLKVLKQQIAELEKQAAQRRY